MQMPVQTPSRPIMPMESGDWSADNTAGRARADELIMSIRESGSPVALGRFMQMVIESGRYGGVEVGFFHRISEHLIRGQ